jgi:hypothetical protein
MKIASLFRHSEDTPSPQPSGPVAPAAAATPAQPVDRRRPVLRCAACHVWSENLVFMRNGADYCVPCAKNLYVAFGTRPAGRRATDITSLPD